MNPSPKIVRFANAIAKAEGFFIPGSVPALAHNPGDLKIPHWIGPTLGIEKIPVFSSDDAGWDALYNELELIASGRSKVYTQYMTILEMAEHWTDTQQIAWARNVATALNTTCDAQLYVYLCD